MKIQSIMTTTALLFSLSTTTYADESYLRYDFVNLVIDDTIDTANPSALQLSLGVALTHHLSFEASAMTGINDDGFGEGYTTKLNSMVGGAIKGSLPLGHGDVYGKVGLANIEVEVNAIGFSGTTYKDTGLTFGFGLEMPLANHANLILEYTDYPVINVNQEVDITTSGFSIGVKSEF